MTQNQERCRVCDKALDDHALVMQYGVAHAGSYDTNGEFRVCSYLDVERNYYYGRVIGLEKVIRLLRWHAPRLGIGRGWSALDLRAQADRLDREVSKVRAIIGNAYPWSD